MRVAVGSDEYRPVVQAALEWLRRQGYQVDYFGPQAPGENQPWPQVAGQVARGVARGEYPRGVLFCWTGTGVSIAANKVPGVRAALCVDAETARGARLWNDANVLCLSLRLTSDILVEEILEAFFGTEYRPNPEDDACLALVRELEAQAGTANPPKAGGAAP